MENTYGIGVANRYALFLDEEEDPLEVLKVQELEKEAKKKNKLSEKENKGKPETKGKVAPAARKGIKDAQNVKTVDNPKAREENNKTKVVPRSTADRSDRNVKFAGESREERNNRRNREERPYPGTGETNRDVRDSARQESGEMRGRGRGAGRGMGRGRGSRGGAGGGGGGSGANSTGGVGGRGGYDSRGKREFDRQSGSDKTGVKPVDKREGGGAHNWGSHRDDIADELRTPHLQEDQDWSFEKTEGDAPAVSESETKEANVSAEGDNDNTQTTEEEPRELTLDEYYALKGSRQKPTYNLRKAGEGEDLSQWKKMYALKRKEGDEDEEEEEEYDASEYPQRVGRQKHLLDIDIHFADSRRGTRGRGRGGPRGAGRGGTRGGAVVAAGTSGGPPSRGPGGEGRSPPAVRGFGDRSDAYHRTQRQSAPKVDDEHDFPSLG
ncbi:SERPINE1 mRNA-binding protein 1 [Anabrus simplex]|uniref:SERPINE1 mRNA-binding protein 1 n=1 Tax=Anabrus simplex TaxID=316456 RepID=UPI0035A34019